DEPSGPAERHHFPAPRFLPPSGEAVANDWATDEKGETKKIEEEHTSPESERERWTRGIAFFTVAARVEHAVDQRSPEIRSVVVVEARRIELPEVGDRKLIEVRCEIGVPVCDRPSRASKPRSESLDRELQLEGGIAA